MNPKDLLIKGGRLIDPSQKIDDNRDILIRNGKISAVGKTIDAGKTSVFDASGMIVMPGLIDMHVHLREPGNEEAETIHSGCEYAAPGGYCTLSARQLLSGGNCYKYRWRPGGGRADGGQVGTTRANDDRW